MFVPKPFPLSSLCEVSWSLRQPLRQKLCLAGSREVRHSHQCRLALSMSFMVVMWDDRKLLTCEGGSASIPGFWLPETAYWKLSCLIQLSRWTSEQNKWAAQKQARPQPAMQDILLLPPSLAGTQFLLKQPWCVLISLFFLMHLEVRNNAQFLNCSLGSCFSEAFRCLSCLHKKRSQEGI